MELIRTLRWSGASRCDQFYKWVWLCISFHYAIGKKTFLTAYPNCFSVTWLTLLLVTDLKRLGDRSTGREQDRGGGRFSAQIGNLMLLMFERHDGLVVSTLQRCWGNSIIGHNCVVIKSHSLGTIHIKLFTQEIYFHVSQSNKQPNDQRGHVDTILRDRERPHLQPTVIWTMKLDESVNRNPGYVKIEWIDGNFLGARQMIRNVNVTC